MTAVIGILNKTGVALAADSAVTISGGSGRKIYNTAYKIFTLSKYHPVSIMLYSSATFMDVPWEILIKEFRKSLGTKSYDTLQEYQDKFIEYLKKNVNLIDKRIQDDTLKSFIDFVLKKIITDITDENIDEIEKQKTQTAKKAYIKTKLLERINDLLKSYKNDETLIDFKNYTYERFKTKHQNKLKDSFSKYYSALELPNTIMNKLFRVFFNFLVSDTFWGSLTGLVFTGFGNKEIYPSCLPIKIGEVFDNKIRYIIDSDNIAVIGDNLSAAIMPFAQRDVIDTILSGIDDNLENTIYESFESFLVKFLSIIKKEINNDKFKKKIDKIDIKEMIRVFAGNFQTVKKEKHIRPLMSSISSLSKEDLAELAESLIYLTYLKRRMSFSEESVGGPIDVAIITKGDGFIWIKRKHYFNKELNQDFIYKYLRE